MSTLDTAIKAAAQIIVDAALQQMADKAETTVETIAHTIASAPNGATAKYFAGLVRIGMLEAREVLA